VVMGHAVESMESSGYLRPLSPTAGAVAKMLQGAYNANEVGSVDVGSIEGAY